MKIKTGGQCYEHKPLGCYLYCFNHCDCRPCISVLQRLQAAKRTVRAESKDCRRSTADYHARYRQKENAS